MLVQVPVSNMYEEADNCSQVISQVIYGHLVYILDKENNYSLIQSNDGYRGWIDSDHLIVSKTSQNNIRTIHNFCHVYSTPNISKQKPLISLPFGVSLEVLQYLPEANGRWIEIALLNGQKGYIQKGDVSFKNKLLSLEEMFALGYQFLGLPYTWGGLSSFGLDCSGLIQMLHKERGVFLPRDTYQQIECCVPIDELVPGDLIFYGQSPSKIQHVSLYLGNNQIIHASVLPKPVVQITPTDEPTLKERYPFSTLRRIIIRDH